MLERVDCDINFFINIFFRIYLENPNIVQLLSATKKMVNLKMTPAKNVGYIHTFQISAIIELYSNIHRNTSFLFLVSGVYRSCSENGPQSDSCTSLSLSDRSKIEGTECHCSNDLCNQGLKQGSSMIIFIFIVLLIVHN